MPLYKGSKTYLFIPEDKWTLDVPVFISREAYPEQSLGWIDDDTQLWVRPTWKAAYLFGQLGPMLKLLDTGRAPNVLWRVTSFLDGAHPPMLQYPSTQKGIMQAVNSDPTTENYAQTLVGILDQATPQIHYLTRFEAKELCYNTTRLEIQEES